MYDVFADLPFVQVDFSTPSMPPQLDRSLSIAGQKGLANWKGTPRGPLILQTMKRYPHIFRRNELSRHHALYMLNTGGYEKSLEPSELLGNMVCNTRNAFCTLTELELALDQGGDHLTRLTSRAANKMIPDESRGSRRSAQAIRDSWNAKVRNLLRTHACPSPICKLRGGEDAPISCGDDYEAEDAGDDDKIHHAGIFWSKAVRDKVVDRDDLKLTAGDDCHLQLALTACREHEEAIEEIWGKSRSRVILPTGNAILSIASGITRELLAKIVSPKDALARKDGREMLRAALCRMWNERLASNLVEAKGYHV
ncbi:hypothetical protein LTS10_008713 [Elasticomyces elasticus]|nr:hypothetical protein LTS10_008713 [Elasticomyces elasticus]